MLMKVQSDEGQTIVINTNQVCRVLAEGSRATIIQTDGQPVGVKMTADQYYNLVALSEEQAAYEHSKRRSRGL